MKAFTHFCRHINISIMNNTITVYYRNSDWYSPLYNAMKELEYNKERGCFYRFVQQYDEDHHLYHQDHFKRKKSHFHLNFYGHPIDEKRFEFIVGVFLERKIISSEEKDRLINAYRQANLLESEHVVYSKEEEKIETRLFFLQKVVSSIEYKAEDKPDKYMTASTAARALHAHITQAMSTYCMNKSSEAYREFRKTCATAISEARPDVIESRSCLFFKTAIEGEVNKVAKSLERLSAPST